MIMYRHTQQIFLKTIVRCHINIETSLACCNQSSCSYWPDQDHFPMHLQCKWWKNRFHSPCCVLKYIPKLGKGNTEGILFNFRMRYCAGNPPSPHHLHWKQVIVPWKTTGRSWSWLNVEKVTSDMLDRTSFSLTLTIPWLHVALRIWILVSSVRPPSTPSTSLPLVSSTEM